MNRLLRLRPATIALAVAAALGCCATLALAADAAPPAPAPEATAVVASPAAPAAEPAGVIVITATRTERSSLEVPASVDVIEREDLHDAQLRVNASETLARIPGVVALNRQNYAQDLQVSIRGFGARSSFGVRGLRLYVDGVPATLPDGQGQVSNFPLNAAERIEVLRGPFSALYGNSSGGVIALTTPLKPGPTGGEASYAAGSNQTQRAAFDLAGGTAPLAYAVDAESFHTGGYRPHSATGRAILNVRGGVQDTPVGQLRVALNALDSDNAQDPLGLSRALLQANPDQTTPEAIQFNTRKSTRQGTAGADLRSQIGTLSLETSTWFGARAIRQFQAIPASTQAAASSPGGVIDLGRHFGGIDTRATLPIGPFTTTAGLDFERMVEDRFGYNDFTGTTARPTYGVMGTLRRDETNSVNSIDPYLQTELQLSVSWRAFAGLRSTHVDFASSPHFPTSGSAAAAVSYNGVNPTAGVVFRATPRVSYYLSYGRGFETPTLNELAYKALTDCTAPIAGLNTALQAARSNNYELGAKADLGAGLRGGVALFSTRTSDDIVVRCNSGGRSVYANVAQTRRDGVEASIESHPLDGLTLSASAALINARFADGFSTCGGTPCRTINLKPVAAGNKLPSVPARTAWAQARYDAGFAQFSVEGRVQSALYVDDLNSDHAGGAAVLDLSVQRTLKWSTLRPRFFARVDNATNRRYVGSVIVNESSGRFFEPAPTRTWLFGVDLPF